MRRMLWIGVVLALAATTARAQTPASPTSLAADSSAACVADAAGRIDHQACADAAPAGSPVRRLALINLGTQAFLNDDYAAAVRFYDLAQAPNGGEKIYSDASFHAFRGASYRHVGRAAEALTDARTALGLINDTGDLPADARERLAAARIDVELAYSLILPTLREAADPGYPGALAAYRALPVRDWISLSSRAATLEELDDLQGALAASQQVAALKPNEPAVLNNHCYILARLGRAAEALPFCERAVQLAPDKAAVRDSYAVALAGAGRCREARAARARAQSLDPSAAAFRRELDCRPR